MAQMLSMTQIKARARVEGPKINQKSTTIIAHINNNHQKTLLAEFVKDLSVQTVAVNVWVAT